MDYFGKTLSAFLTRPHEMDIKCTYPRFPNLTQTLSVFKGGSVVPVKFQLKTASGTVIQASTLPLWLNPQNGSAMSVAVDESTYADSATSGPVFKWDATSSQYIYNWSTKGFATGYWYRIYAKLDDGTTQSVVVGLR